MPGVPVVGPSPAGRWPFLLRKAVSLARRASLPIAVVHVASTALAWRLSGEIFRATPDLLQRTQVPLTVDGVAELARAATALLELGSARWPTWLMTLVLYGALGCFARVFWLLAMSGLPLSSAARRALARQPGQWGLLALWLGSQALLLWLLAAIMSCAWLEQQLGALALAAYCALLLAGALASLGLSVYADLAATHAGFGMPVAQALLRCRKAPLTTATAWKLVLRLAGLAIVALGLGIGICLQGAPLLALAVHQSLGIVALGLRAAWTAVCAMLCNSALAE